MAEAALINRRDLTRPGCLRAAGVQLRAALGWGVAGRARSELVVARRAMGCEFSIVFPAGVGSLVEAGCAALDEVDRLEQKLSAYREDSELVRLNGLAGHAPVRTDPEVFALLDMAVRLSLATGGAFDAATGALLRAWGFFRGPKHVPSAPELARALEVSGSRRVFFDERNQTVRFQRPGVEFNLGGIGKGYAIDRAVQRIWSRHGVRCALMQGGQSSMRGIGAPPGEPRGWTVDLGDPCGGRRPVARIQLRDRALGSSGADHQFFVERGRRYGHILDPRTGWPACRLARATAIARTAAEADALSTAFFVLGADGTRRFCREHPDVGAVLVVRGTSNAAPEVIVIGAANVEVMA